MTQRLDATTTLAIAVLAGVAIGALGVGAVLAPGADGPTTGGGPGAGLDDGRDAGVTTFESAEAMSAYLERDSSPTAFRGASATIDRGTAVAEERLTVGDASGDGGDGGGDAAMTTSTDSGATDGAGGSSGGAPRHSETNVQVRGVSEPDAVKTDGEWLYYAGDERERRPSAEGTDVLDVRDPAMPELNGTVPTDGQLFLRDDVLVTLGEENLWAYDVSDPTDPEQLWHQDLEHRIETARMANGTIYLVTRDSPDPSDPCPIRPFGTSGPDDGPGVPEIPCTDVLRPADADAGDTTYTALTLDAESGEVGDEVSFVGTGQNTVVYASGSAIYVTYDDSPGMLDARLAYLTGPGSEHLDETALERLEELQSYDISEQAMETELRRAVEKRLQRLPEDEREDVERELGEGWQDYAAEHREELVRTGVVRIGIDGADGTELSVEETGQAPGRVHDQFSLSERNGHLHVATTLAVPGANSTNALYTLDSGLDVADSVTGLGENQRIYSVRYDGDRAYVVTFRQIDPFYVIDVSDPTEMETLGELKLPGFSDYMHPLGDDRVLGVGEEDGQVKATVFDASDPTDPTVADEVQLPSYGTEVSTNHHAFLQDPRHEVVFLPGHDAGYVLSYADGLERVATVRPDGRVHRAAYVGDSLYVFGTEEVVVLDESDWSVETRVDLA